MSSANTATTNLVLFGAGFPPLTASLKTNDTYMRTDTGLSTGLVTEEYVFSQEANAWILTPGGTVASPVSWSNSSW